MEVNNEQISLEIVKTPKKRGRKPKIKDTSEPIMKEKKKEAENLNQEIRKMIYQRYLKKGVENQKIDTVLFLKIYQ